MDADFSNASPLLSQPQNRYADNAQAIEESDKPSIAEPGEQIGKYFPPPEMNKRNASGDSPPVLQNPLLRNTRKFESTDYSEFKKTALDLPLAKWNPLFDRPPPLSEHSLQPLIDDSVLAPVQPEVHTLKATVVPLIKTVIDSSRLVPAEGGYEITILIQEESIVPADQDFP